MSTITPNLSGCLGGLLLEWWSVREGLAISDAGAVAGCYIPDMLASIPPAATIVWLLLGVVLVVALATVFSRED